MNIHHLVSYTLSLYLKPMFANDAVRLEGIVNSPWRWTRLIQLNIDERLRFQFLSLQSLTVRFHSLL